MKIIDRIKSLLSPKYFSTRPGADIVSQTINFNKPAVYSEASSSRFIIHGFAGNASVYTIVAKASKKFGHINRGVYKITEEKAWKRYNQLTKGGLADFTTRMQAKRYRNKAYGANPDQVSGKLNDLIQRPNPTQGQDAFFEACNISRMLTGECFIWLNRGVDANDERTDDQIKKLPVLEMYVLPPNQIEIIPDDNDPWKINGYWLNIENNKATRWQIRACDIIFWKKPNPIFDGWSNGQHLRGLSPLRPGNKILTQDNDATDATVAMYQNGGAKGVLANESLNTLTSTQETQLRGVVDRKLNNKDMKAAVATIQGKWEYHNIGLSSVDQELLKGGEQAFIRLCNLLDVPPALFMVDQTYENRRFAIKDWLTNSVIPDCCSLRDELNRALLIAFGLPKGIMIDNDISDIPELQEDMGELVKWLALMPWLTPNEKREYIGEDALADDGMDEIWVTGTMVKMSDAGMPDVTASLDQQGVNDYNKVVNEPA